MKYALGSCVAAAAIFAGGVAMGGMASAAAGIPLEPAPSMNQQPAQTGQPIVFSPLTGSAECLLGIAPWTDPYCARIG
ncbi:hypothetical protein KO481_05210 [Nocardia sp. NEAU-G5]|uniref:Uncharacterized protein n=1 Tax=Nocardia albiluteola TaxID=2842303 RepID=A0ABS6ASB6_9NOCA|nr:hypothetical protein [Nocardia albiluteola]MBU3060921.1 hypothetical protein [Nocardia albiluteola]